MVYAVCPARGHPLRKVRSLASTRCSIEKLATDGIAGALPVPEGPWRKGGFVKERERGSRLRPGRSCFCGNW